jgi:predicted transposase YbfD/YdcC
MLLTYLALRAHWGIENSLHLAFDEQRQRKNNSDANMAIIRHMALHLLKAEQSSNIGVKNKRLKAAWDNNYLMKVLTD